MPSLKLCRTVVTMLVLGWAVAAAEAGGQTLGVGRDRFTVDGDERFLLFVSYFHGLDRPPATLASDLAWLQSKGIGGIRVWPNAATPKLMAADGSLDATALDRLERLVAAAAARGLVVDVTFHREGVCASPERPPCDFTLDEYSAAIAATARELADGRNILFDLQNEWNVHSTLTATELAGIRRAVLAVRPDLVTTASVSGGGYQAAADASLDVLSYHGRRDAGGRWAVETADDVQQLRAALARTARRQGPGKGPTPAPAAASAQAPIYLQEPNRFPAGPEPHTYYDSDPASYWLAARSAKAQGAAAWTFHTAAGFDLAGEEPFAVLLQPAEREVLERLAAELTRTAWGAGAGSAAPQP